MVRLPGVANARALAVTVAVAIVLDAALAIAFDWCVQVEIASSQEKSALLAEVARDYNASGARVSGRCVRVTVTRRASGEVEETLARGWDPKLDGEPPVVWSPAAKTWTILLRQQRAARGLSDLLPANLPTLMQSPLVIGMPREMAVALGYPERPLGWSDILSLARDPAGWGSAKHPEWDPFRLGKTNPTISTSGLHALVSTYFAAAGVERPLVEADLSNPTTVAFVRDVESAVVHYGESVSTFLENLLDADRRGASLTFASAIAMAEKEVRDYNNGDPTSTGIAGVGPRVPLRAIYPKEGTLMADHPYAILNAAWVDDIEREAAGAFLSYLLGPAVQARFTGAGFRDHAGTPGPEINAANGLNPLEPRRVILPPDGPVLERMQRSWNDLRKRAHLLIAIDVSHSMGEALVPGGETKLALAKQAASAALEQLAVDDDVGIWVFGQASAGATYRELAAIAPLASRREQLRTLIADLTPSPEGSPLFATTRAGIRSLGERYDSKRINAVMLLTTGRNEDPRDVDRQGLLRELQSQSEERFVRVFAVTYGSSADAESMQLIAKASRGAVYPATDPKTIGRVITNILSNF
jgi:Ca-activated chloride channel homolog